MKNITETRPISMLDGDHFAFGWTLNGRFPEIMPYQWCAVRNLAEAFPGKIIPLTNRPITVAQQFAEMIGSGLACAESGATFFVCGAKHINEKFIDYQKRLRPEVLKIVKEQIKRLGLEKVVEELEGNLVTACFYSHEPGMETVMPKLNETVIEAVDKQGLKDLVSISDGVRLDISPRDLTKEQALLVLADGLYESVYRKKMPWDMLIIGDDSKSAIPLFKRTIELSGGKARLITVGNADSELKTFVSQNEGYVSERLFAAGVKDGLQWALNSLGIQKQQRGVWTVTKSS